MSQSKPVGDKVPSGLLAVESGLGFDQIREIIEAECLGDLGREMAKAIRLNRTFSVVVRWQEQVHECIRLLSEGIPFPDQHYFDLRPISDCLEIENYVLMPDQWSLLSRCLKTIDKLISMLRKGKNHFPQLYALCEKVELPADLFFSLDRIFDEDGVIKDTASPELNRLRKSKIDEQARLRRRLEQSLKNAISQGFIAEDASLTVRNGRMVIPILAEYKRRVRGFVHDESATGQTVFMEPEEALESNNAIREIQFAEQREIHRILTQLTEDIRPNRGNIANAGQFLGTMDLIRAKARFGLRVKSSFPAHHEKPDFGWYDARHPLLFLSHQKSHKPIVPLRIWLTNEKRVLVVSGPNAGGKSICLKTVGLIQYMWQSGVPVPVGEGSTMGHFEKILTDIGDHQSIENDLSTYSSHLSNMKNMLIQANERSLVLIDEFGTGTDPALGGPIAEAILEALCHKRIFGVVNTHYTNLKNFASRHPMVENASMKFDGERMEPLFVLEMGQPGSSYALEIAEKIGLPRPVLNQARNKIGTKKLNVDKLISELEEEKRTWETKNLDLKIRDKLAKKLLEDNQKLQTELQNKKKIIVNEARLQGKKIVEEANRKVEEAVRSIKESQAEKSVVVKARIEITKLKEQMEPEILEQVEEKDETVETELKSVIISGEIQLGDSVRIKGTESVGKIIAYRGKDAEVQIGDLKTNIKVNRLERMSTVQTVAKSAARRATAGLDMNQKMLNFQSELDLRGLRTDEALSLVDSWIDEAILLGQKELRILHGKGNGILRTQIRIHLKKYRQVGRMVDEHADRGGAGITLVTLDI